MSNWVNRHLRVATLLSLSLVASLLSSCASAPTRADAEAFSLLAEGQIAPAQVQAFASCLLDGFDKAHFMLSNVTSRQQRRFDSYRVETLSGGRILLVSADAYDSGRVALNESKAAALIDTSGERDAFAQCLSKFTISR
jgi:hypothetical protein